LPQAQVLTSKANFRMQAIRGVWPGAGLEWGRFRPKNHARMVPSWLTECSVSVARKQAALVYASSAKRIASTRAGPFLGTVFFFDRGLMMLMAEASSCVFKCAA
jgi:hypothetical protein